MNRTPTPPEHTPEQEPGDPTPIHPAPIHPAPIHPADVLLNLIVILLAPMFIDASGGNIAFARMAALETVNAYRIRHNADLIAVAQIIAFGLAALGSLSLSMLDDISVSMALRLRGNANALNRSAEQNRRALNQSQRESPAHPSASIAHQPATAPAHAPTHIQTPSQPPEPQPAIEEREHQAMWANAMVNVAAELTASLDTLPPEQREAVSDRAASLTSIADELRAGVSAPRPKVGDLHHLMRPSPA